MTNSQRLATVRKRFLHWLHNANDGSLLAEADDSLIRQESMLIRDEYFCGRKFIGEHYNAVWFIEEDVLKIYRAGGPLELVLRGAEIDEYGADAIEETLVAEKLSVAPLAVSQPVVQSLSVTAVEAISGETRGQESVPPEAVTPDPALEEAVREDATVDDSANTPVANSEAGPRILQLPAANGESNQTAPTTDDQIEAEPSGNPEIRKAA